MSNRFNSYGLADIRVFGKESDQFEVPSESNYGESYIVQRVSFHTKTREQTGGALDLSCTCPSFRYPRTEDNIPGCKHCERVLAEFEPVTKFTGFRRK